MILAFFQRGTPHVEILILATLGIFLILWGMFVLLGWLKSKPWRHEPESSIELHSTDELLSDDGDEHHDHPESNRSGFEIPFGQDVLPHQP